MAVFAIVVECVIPITKETGASLVPDRPAGLTLPRGRRFWTALLVLVTIAPPFLVLVSGRAYGGYDFLNYFIPHAERARRDFLGEGALPLWDPYQFAGTPHAGSLQDGTFYPPHLLLLLLPAGVAFQVLVACHLALAAFGTYRLARSLPAGRPASTLAAIAYALSFTLGARVAAGHYAPFVTMTQAPLLLFLIRHLMERPRWDRACVLGLYGGAVLLSGHPQFLYHLAAVATAFAAAGLVRLRRSGRPVGHPLLLLGLAFGISLSVGSPNLLSALEIRSHTLRGEVDAAGVYADVPPDFAFLPRDFVSYLIPLLPRGQFIQDDRWSGFWHEKAPYVGVLPLMCAAFALCSRPRRPIALFLGGLALAALLDAAARHLPFHALFARLLPGYGSFRVPARTVWVATLALSLLAGIGWDHWTGSQNRRRWLLPSLGLGIAVLLGGTLYLRFGGGGEVLLFVTCAAGSAALLMAARMDRPGWKVAACGLAALELAGHAWSVIPTVPRRTQTASPWYLPDLGPEPSRFRVLDLTEQGYRSAVSGVRLMDGYGYPLSAATRRLYASAWDPPAPIEFNRLGAGREIAHPEILDLLNVGWIVCARPPPERGLIETSHGGALVLYRRPTAGPAAFLRSGPVSVHRRRNALEAQVVVNEDDRLILSESWMPGWRADVDGHPQEVCRYQEALIAVPLPPGTHRVRLVYRPRTLLAGLWISGTASLVTGGTLVVLLFRRRRNRRAQPLPPPSGA